MNPIKARILYGLISVLTVFCLALSGQVGGQVSSGSGAGGLETPAARADSPLCRICRTLRQGLTRRGSRATRTSRALPLQPNPGLLTRSAEGECSNG